MPEVELLDKTELWVTGVTLRSARLPALAEVVAGVLDLPPAKVIVTDVRDRHVTFDVLEPRVRLEHIAGREHELLALLREVDGVELDASARVHSFGVLGIIATPPDQVREVLAAASEVDEGILRYVRTRVAVVSTGAEVEDHRVHDTNFEVIAKALATAGYEVEAAGTVPDDDVSIAGRVARLVSDGFGLVITTGGVGAEDKDRTIEALQVLDPELSTATLATYEKGHGRHVKDSVRVGVGVLGWTTVIALPGPTAEVEAALPVILKGLDADRSPAALAEAIAVVLRDRLPRRSEES